MESAEAGWLKLYRNILEKAVWQLPDAQRIVFVSTLMLANHQGRQWLWKGTQYTARPGQFVTSLPSLAKTARVSIRSVRTALENLSKLGFLTDEATGTGRLITVNNWASYQGAEKEPAALSPDDRQSSDRLPTPNKNDKNDKNGKETSSCSRIKSGNEPSQLHYDLAEHLRSSILRWKPNAKTPVDLRVWAEDIRLMMTRDNREEMPIAILIEFATEDPFWRSNILSAAKLREKYDQLEAKMHDVDNRRALTPANPRIHEKPRGIVQAGA